MNIFIILKYIFSFLGAMFLIISTFSKKKDKTLTIQTVNVACDSIAAIFAGSFTSVSSNVISAIRNIVCIKIKNKIIPMIVFTTAIAVFGFLVNRSELIGLLPVFASILYTIWIFVGKSPVWINIGIFINVTLWAIHNFYFTLYPSFVANIVVLIFCIINIIRTYNKERKMKK